MKFGNSILNRESDHTPPYYSRWVVAGLYKNRRPQRGMNIQFVGRCLFWLYAAHSLSPFHSLQIHILLSFSLLSILWLLLNIWAHRETSGWHTRSFSFLFQLQKCFSLKMMVAEKHFPTLCLLCLYMSMTQMFN